MMQTDLEVLETEEAASRRDEFEAPTFDEQDIAVLAHEFWQARGCPEGSPEQDWFQAVEALGARRHGERADSTVVECKRP